MSLKLVPAAVLVLALSACASNPPPRDLGRLAFMVGCWTSPVPVAPGENLNLEVWSPSESGLMFGYLTSRVMALAERDRRAVMIEGGMQNSGLALGIIAVHFQSDLGMLVIASLWGMWHIVSGMACALWWRRKDRVQGLMETHPV